MKCKKCDNESYKPPKGGMCPTWSMAYALNNGLCLECAIKEVKNKRNNNNNRCLTR